ncbi:hypothetical protein [Pseudonocardia sp. TRM90224]|uniref:hypothetical protein n=1 Tax=Pseudonocardia sp. TRM90224 TaxID=2812678 RepID=UPI001E55938D|nr:hypothetical protein [Pseudonocardia sp. TRM90224]
MPYAPPPPPRRRSVWPWVILIVIALFAGSAITIVAVTARGVIGRPAAAPGPFGDLRAADPCSLIDTGELQQFGQVVLYPDIGPASGCTAQIDVGGGSLVEVEVAFATPTAFTGAGELTTVGDLTVLRRVWTTSYVCGHTIKTPDGSRVQVTARAAVSATTNICGFADDVVDSAVPKLAAGQVGKREIKPAPNSLLDVDVCTLVERGDSTVPGLDLSKIEPGYGGWACTFGAPSTTGPWVYLEVQFSGSREGDPTQSIAGRTVIKLDEGAVNDCSMRVIQRDYSSADGWERTESLLVRVFTGTGRNQASGCQATTELIEKIGPRLPQPS